MLSEICMQINRMQVTLVKARGSGVYFLEIDAVLLPTFIWWRHAN